MNPEGWHVGKTIDLSHILTTLGIVIAIFVGIDKFDDRIDLLEYRVDANELALLAEHEYVKEIFELIREDLMYIRNRVDNGDN